VGEYLIRLFDLPQRETRLTRLLALRSTRGLPPRSRLRLTRTVRRRGLRRRPRFLSQQRFQLGNPPRQHLIACPQLLDRRVPSSQRHLHPCQPLQQLHDGRRIGHAVKDATNHPSRSRPYGRKSAEQLLQLLIIDDLHFLDCSQREGRASNDHIKYLANHAACTLVGTGIDLEDSPLLSEGGGGERATQTAGRFAHHKLAPFTAASKDAAAEWIGVVKTLEDALVLFEHQPASLARQH
jgi:hypothetical protein